MKLTRIGTDFLTINEENMKNDALLGIPRVHLIKFSFVEPTKEKIEAVMALFSRTNRFVISDNIKLYNDILKVFGKKFYVENTPGVNIISFLRKNNKVLLNFDLLQEHEIRFTTHPQVFNDVLRNVEVIQLNKKLFERHKVTLETWPGNVILSDKR